MTIPVRHDFHYYTCRDAGAHPYDHATDRQRQVEVCVEIIDDPSHQAQNAYLKAMIDRRLCQDCYELELRAADRKRSGL